MSEFLVGFNWKQNPETFAEAQNLLTQYLDFFSKNSVSHDTIIFAPSMLLSYFYSQKHGFSSNLKYGLQHISDQLKGAFTGENSVLLSKYLGAEFSLIGHSETRKIQKLSDQDCQKRLILSIQNGVRPVLCIGFEPEGSESGIDKNLLKSQVLDGLGDFTQLENFHDNLPVVAYEPVWAIGTGKTASEKQIADVLGFLREVLQEKYGSEIADKIVLMYGGSVDGNNASTLRNIPNLGGFLVGGASLSVEKFSKILIQ